MGATEEGDTDGPRDLDTSLESVPRLTGRKRANEKDTHPPLDSEDEDTERQQPMKKPIVVSTCRYSTVLVMLLRGLICVVLCIDVFRRCTHFSCNLVCRITPCRRLPWVANLKGAVYTVVGRMFDRPTIHSLLMNLMS